MQRTFHLKRQLGRRITGLFIGVIGITAAMACTGLDNLDARSVEGILQGVSSLTGDVTVQLKDGTEVTFNLADIDVESLTGTSTGAALETGDTISLELDSSDRVRAAKSRKARAAGVITAFDAGSNQLTLETENGVNLVVNVTPQTRIRLERGRDGRTVDSLEPGRRIRVSYDAGSSDALSIDRATGRSDNRGPAAANRGNRPASAGRGNRPDSPDRGDRIAAAEREDGTDAESEANGTITAIDQTGHTITITSSDGVETTYEVLDSTVLDIGGPSFFDDLQAGMEVEIEFDPDTLQLVRVQAEDAGDDEAITASGSADDDEGDDETISGSDGGNDQSISGSDDEDEGDDEGEDD